jgi:predicted homoserine dehydrogenase-like protein
VATGFVADAVAVAKRDLSAGETLDGEGGYSVVGRLMSADESLRRGGLPIGLAQGARLRAALKAGELVTWQCVSVDETLLAVRLRRELEAEPRSSG